jgi:shikimate 5-dehydrogenase
MTSVPAETVEEALRFADLADVKGMAVTIPHKERVMAYLDEIDPVARAIGAVNTVVFRDGRRLGFNTDADGFAAAVTAFVGAPSLKGVRTAVLGAGGAAKAVVFALERLGADVEVFHRRPLTDGFSLIVNATPVDPVPDYVFTGGERVYDLRYEPPETPLMARARAAGCRVENGLSMLAAQARLQRRIFFDGR